MTYVFWVIEDLKENVLVSGLKDKGNVLVRIKARDGEPHSSYHRWAKIKKVQNSNHT